MGPRLLFGQSMFSLAEAERNEVTELSLRRHSVPASLAHEAMNMFTKSKLFVELDKVAHLR